MLFLFKILWYPCISDKSLDMIQWLSFIYQNMNNFLAADESELISPKKNKKIKFGKVLKGIKVPKPKSKTKKGSVTNDSESVADDLVIESSKVWFY